MENINKYKKAIAIIQSPNATINTSNSEVARAVSTLANLVDHFDYAQHLVKAYQQAIAVFMSTEPDAAYKLQGIIFDEQQKLKPKPKKYISIN